MAVCYDRLFHRMIDKRMTNAQLMSMAGFSPNIITRLKRNDALWLYHKQINYGKEVKT